MQSETVSRHLKNVSLFKELTDTEIESIVQIAQIRNYKAHTFVFMQDDPLDRVFFIQKGKVKIYKTDVHGKEQIVSVLKEGDMFPHVGFFKRGTYPAHAELIEKSTLIVIPIEDFETILLQNPEVCVKLFRVMGEKIIDLQNRLEEQILHNTYEQILMLLLRLSKAYGEPIDDKRVRLNTHFTNRELANMIGTSRETISRTLTKLRKKDMIALNKYGSFIISTEAIQNELFNM